MEKSDIKYAGKGQSARLNAQHEASKGVEGIFGNLAKAHDKSIHDVSIEVFYILAKDYPNLEFRMRKTLSKKEINMKLNSFDTRLGKTLFVESSKISPDGGIIEVKDKHENWRIVLVSESKHQGNDIEKIKKGILQGKNKDKDLMVAGNAIERVHKNILEIRNFMIDESHFPYVVFLQGTNFAVESIFVKRPDGREVKIGHDMGGLNRIDRVSASNYGMPINTNLCKNIEISGVSLQSASLYFQCMPWESSVMLKILLDVANTSIGILGENNAFSLSEK